MKTFILMTKLAPQDGSLIGVSAKLKDRAKCSREWVQHIMKECPGIQFKAHYALLGYWDFMDIYDAPDEKTAAKVSLLTRSYIPAQVESWLAIPSDELMSVTQELAESEKKPDH